MKTTNEYSRAYPQYQETPKAVLAAVAFSLAMRMCDDNQSQTEAMLRHEWDRLCENGIVPQKRPGS